MLEEGIRAERGSSKERALYHAALFLWLVGRSDKAREYSDRLLKVVPGSEVGLVLKGWIDLTSERDAIMKKSIKFFEEAASNHSQQRSSLHLYTFVHSFQCTHTVLLHSVIPPCSHVLISPFPQSWNSDTSGSGAREGKVLLSSSQLQPCSRVGWPGHCCPPKVPPCSGGEDEGTSCTAGL